MSQGGILRKHVAIIHFHSMMTVLQRKVFNTLLFEAFKSRVHNSGSAISYEFKTSFFELAKKVDFNSHNTQYLKEAIDEFASMKVEWNLLEDKLPDNLSFLNLRALYGPPTFYKNGFFKFSLHKEMLELLKNPSVYGTIDLYLQSQFESKYAHSLYENSSRFLNLNKSRFISLEVFRKMLGVNGKNYESLSELTRCVLRPSLEEVNDRSSFSVGLHRVYSGNRGVGFDISVNARKNIIYKQSYNRRDKIFDLIKDTFGVVNEAIVYKILSSYSDSYILEKINYTKENVRKTPSGFYPPAYFMSALKYDYKPHKKTILENKIDKEDRHEKARKNIESGKVREFKADLEHWKKRSRDVSNSEDTKLKAYVNITLQKVEKRLKNYLAEAGLDHKIEKK